MTLHIFESKTKNAMEPFMLMTKWMHRVGAIACTASILATTTATFAETPSVNAAETKAAVTDVVLGTRGTLMGLVKDTTGDAKGHQLVTIGYSGNEVAAVETLDDGSFVIEGLREGTHVIQADGKKSTFRFWEADKAPPGAKPEITLVAQQVPVDDGAVQLIPEPQPAPIVPVHNGYHPRRGFLGRAFANYPILTAAGLLGAGIGSGIAIGSSSSDTPASP
ncbi:MAG: hypothetical protein CMK23_02875 [Porticoccaceae bacterium]|jgi:hypothetical protein|nr:hypothetical protein [Porticoccaceae bacterium]|tara:strand:+ start:8296 stop:8958 length:663 start_codon:yes stop_codon:yes gene_type:complete